MASIRSRIGENMEDRYLFKAKFDDSDRWVNGWLVKINDNYFIIPGYASKISAFCFSASNIIEVKKDTICQCTGLKDKNGKLIWENDVIATDCGNARVMYSNDPSPYENSFYVGFEVIFENITDNENYRHDLGYWIKFRGFEVIGNIFDNPDLLESEE